MLVPRRHLLATGLFGLGAAALPGFALGEGVAGLTGFTHSVASGEPGADSMLLWTRYVPPGRGEATVRVEVAEDAGFARVVGGAAQMTGPWRDHTVKLTVDGLSPGRDYHYRFVAPDGRLSPVGRTRTLPADGVRPWRAAIFSCANIGFGWFNAYAHAAARDDLDCAIHLGDYFYEYAPGEYPTRAEAVAGRIPAEWSGEAIHLADYRLRYASYRADPDLQALHARLAMIAQWDDHESADNSYEWGAENHQPATEGDWNARRAAAVQAYREWMPVSEEPWRAYDIGALATLYRTETRLLARTEQADYVPLLKSADAAAALARFRDGTWRDPARTMMGTQQEHWLAGAMAASVRAGRRWQVVGFGTVMGETVLPEAAAGWTIGGSAEARGYVAAGLAATRAGLPFNMDNWGGYPAARARFLRAALAAGGDTVVLSGDSHNAWAYDLRHEGRPAAVEFAGTSVTSPGFESGIKTDPRAVAAAMVGVNPELAWCDTARRGYMAMTIAPDRVTNAWIMNDTVRARSPRGSIVHEATVKTGQLVLA